MIVRNEAAILERCLRSVADYITCWLILDTGSNDRTPWQIEEFFATRGIPGALVYGPFENFSQARNHALDQVRASPLGYDYLLLTDADMEFVVGDAAFRDGLSAAAYDVQQRSGVHYWNTRFLRRDSAARYVGATHEYLDLAGGKERLGGAWFLDHADGSNRPGKFERDVALLQEELARDPDNTRAQFYLAQTYRDMGRTADAEAAYGRARRWAAGTRKHGMRGGNSRACCLPWAMTLVSPRMPWRHMIFGRIGLSLSTTWHAFIGGGVSTTPLCCMLMRGSNCLIRRRIRCSSRISSTNAA
jgi:tetratricopeptide (TPR) repeat protein